VRHLLLVLLATVACTGDVVGKQVPAGDGGQLGGDGQVVGDAAGFADADPAVAFCPYLAEHSYAHRSDAFFEPSEVIRIDVDMTPADWQYQLDNPDLEEYRPAAVTFCGERLEGVGMRFKKSTHPNADLEEGYAKNPIVLDLNEFAPGQRMRGLRKINLEYGSDMMLVAERLNWEMLAAAGLEVARVNHARLYMNGDYVGLFTNVERVDRSYANYHWGDNDGQLYKHSYCGTFRWAGSDASGYTGDPRCYSPKPNDSVTDYADLIHTIDVLNNTAAGDLASALPTVWNVDGWIPTMAALQVLGYGDTPNANGNNFYTYYPATGGPAELAVWDLDGGYWWDGAPCEHPADVIGWDLFRIADCFSNLPLFDRVVANSAWRQRYLEAARDFLVGPFAPAAFTARKAALVDLISVAVSEDPNRRGDDAEWNADLAEVDSRQAARAANVREQLIDEGFEFP
jgi:hypothetical protein